MRLYHCVNIEWLTKLVELYVTSTYAAWAPVQLSAMFIYLHLAGPATLVIALVLTHCFGHYYKSSGKKGSNCNQVAFLTVSMVNCFW